MGKKNNENINNEKISTKDFENKKHTCSPLYLYYVAKDWILAKYTLANAWADEIYEQPWIIIDESQKDQFIINSNSKMSKKLNSTIDNKVKNPTNIKLDKNILKNLILSFLKLTKILIITF